MESLKATRPLERIERRLISEEGVTVDRVDSLLKAVFRYPSYIRARTRVSTARISLPECNEREKGRERERERGRERERDVARSAYISLLLNNRMTMKRQRLRA